MHFPVIASILLALGAAADANDDLFKQSVAPIFVKHCIKCHGGATPKGGFSLAERQTFFDGGDSGVSVVSGKPDESMLLDFLVGDKPEMPKDARPLSHEEVETIRRWIKEGAKWPKDFSLKKRADSNWWSLAPIKRPPIPAASSPWPRNPIDAFILAKQQEKMLTPAPEADRRTLIRRLHFDLIGLPPTPDAVRRFIDDSRPDAYERLVDELLASPRYGERWGRHWLDLVHYGDTHGFDKDKRREHSWPYRDYVIASFNRDTPYGRFVRAQIAGDRIEPDDPDGITATGFIAAGPWDFVGHVELREGTVDKAITRNLDRDDMVATTMTTFASMTVHCARCHDHPYDPFTQADYYGLQAVFAGVDRADRPFDRDPAVHRERRLLNNERARLLAERTRLNEDVNRQAGPKLAALDRELASLREERSKPVASNPGTSPSNGYHSAIMPTADAVKWVQVDLGRELPIESVRIIPARPTDFPDTPGFGFPARYKVESSLNAECTQSVALADFTRDDVANPRDQAVEIEGRGRIGRYVRVTATRLWPRTGDFVFALGELEVIVGGKNVAADAAVTALDSIEAGRWNKRYLVDRYSSRAPLDGSAPAAQKSNRLNALRAEIERLEKERGTLLESTVDAPTRSALAKVETNLNKSDARLAALPKPELVYAASNSFMPSGSFVPARKPREIHVLHRGEIKNPMQRVEPGAVAVVKGVESRFSFENPDDESVRRAALAAWLTDRNHPLTWRSIVNRVWQHHFGRGLVETPNDFGQLGAAPTYPQLLDWLAAQFRDEGESIKSLHRLIVTSSAYRQASENDREKAQLDSGNQFLWRMNRRRLDAESIRDYVLSTTDMLDYSMGGPGYNLFGFKDDHSPHYLYEEHNVDDPKSLRRTVYRFVVRSVPDPLMTCFDCADPSLNVPARDETITALQALALLNNPLLVRQSRHLAALAERNRDQIEGQIAFIYERALGRAPTDEETRTLSEYARRHGLANLCRLVLNMNEFLFID